MTFLLGLVVLVGLVWQPVRADELDDINQQIGELTKAREQSVSATKPLEAELGRLTDKLNSIETGIAKAKADLRGLEASISKREADFAIQYALLAERVASFYKASRAPSCFFVFCSSGSFANFIRDLFYQEAVTDKDKDVIAQISLDLIQLEKDKQRAEDDKVRLADLQVKLDKEAEFFRGEVAGAKSYQAKLSQQIASLTAKQQQIIAQKLGSLNLPQSLGAGAMVCTDDQKLDPGFGNAYAFYTYGIPHRVGMNQYGAYGRANAGQTYDQILRAYYNIDGYQDGVNATIKVNDSNGFNQGNIIWTGSLEDYVKRIYEIPERWPIASLKAQAIAARSYVLATTNNGNDSICANQNCQVFKTGPKGGAWDQAVSETSGKVMIQGGQVIKAWYSSTDGGYTHTSGEVWGGDKPWTKNLRDTTGDVGSFGDLNDRAYDKESKCFYAAQGWRNEYGKSAWLKGEEVADIANVILLAREVNDDPKKTEILEHLYQTDKPHPYGKEIWNEEKVKSELRSREVTPLNSVSGVSIGADFGSGKTTQVTVDGRPFSGSEFKDWFNLRAPANIQIVGPLYNVERR